MTTISPQERRRSAAQPHRFGLLVTMVMTLLGCRRESPSSELLVFAAASTADAMTDVGHDFTAAGGQEVRFSFGPSRDLARQIQAGAPAGVILAADAETVDMLVEAKLVRPEDRRVVAKNRLVVIVPKNATTEIRSPADLAKAEHIAIGDPKVVPAGNYARKWLEAEGAWAAVEAHMVPTIDVRAALAAVDQGHAEAGIVYQTDAARTQGVRIAYEVPVGKTPPISYVAARVDSVSAPGAQPFVEFLMGPSGRATFQRHGFMAP